MITNAQLTHTPGPSTCRFPHIGVPSLFVLLYTLPEGWISSQICTFSSFCCRRPVIFVLLLTLVRREYQPEDPEHYFPAVVGVSYTLLLYQEILVYKILLQSKRYFLNLEDLRTNALPSLSRDCFGVTTAGKPVVKILA